eukprot:scaffold753_cov82-Isochrysis_galbana.AAC.1
MEGEGTDNRVSVGGWGRLTCHLARDSPRDLSALLPCVLGRSSSRIASASSLARVSTSSVGSQLSAHCWWCPPADFFPLRPHQPERPVALVRRRIL